MKWSFPIMAFCLGASACVADKPSGISENEARDIFVKHDCCDRLSNTKISKVGILKAERRTYSIFELNFINPVSEHGMQRIAIFEEDKFIGSYITEGAAISIHRTNVNFSCNNADGQPPSTSLGGPINISKGKLPQQHLICGMIAYHEATI